MLVALQQVLPWQPSLLFVVQQPPHFFSPALSLSGPPSLSFSQALLIKRHCNNTFQAATKYLQDTKCIHPPVMPEVTHLASMKPQLPTVIPSFSTIPSTQSVLATTMLLPWEDLHMQVHTILIVVIFCVVCLLLLLAFLYAFCFHCSISSSPKDSHRANGCSLDREDATFKCSSSDNQSVGNVV